MLERHYPNRLCFLRRRARLSQKQIAVLVGVKDRSVISRYERGETIPSLEVASKYEDIFGVFVKDMFSQLRSRWRQEVETAAQTIHKFKLPVHWEES